MGLESASFIDDLVTTNPVAGDSVAQGDDHLRLLKTALKTSFPGVTQARYLETARADLASASSPDLWATTSNYVNITGTTNITDFADAAHSGQQRLVRFDDVLTLTHNAAALDLPGQDDIVTAAGDHALFVAHGTTVHRCVAYFRASGRALIAEATPTAADLEALEYGRHTIIIPAVAMTPTASAGATPNEYSNLGVLDFDESDKARFCIPMPKSWDKGVLNFKAYCTIDTGASAAETVTWSLAAVALGHDSAMSIALGTAEVSTATVTANDDLLVGTESDDLTVGNVPEGDEELLIFEITRTTDGTVGASVQVSLLAIMLYMELDAGNDA